MTSEGNRCLLELGVQIKNDFSGVDAIICCSTKMKSVHLQGTYLTIITRLQSSAAKPDPFFWVEPNFGPKIRIELGRVGPQGKKTGPI